MNDNQRGLQIATIGIAIGALILAGAAMVTAGQNDSVTELSEYLSNRLISHEATAKKLDARIIGLGAFTSVIGDKGKSIARESNASITTGNSLTVAMVIKGCEEGAAANGIDLGKANVTVIGATGSIGRACSKLISESRPSLTICAPNSARLEHLRAEIMRLGSRDITIDQNPKSAVKNAEVVIIASSAIEKIISIDDFEPNTIVCDVTEPSNVLLKSKGAGVKVNYVKGGLVKTPVNIDLGISTGLPSQVIHGCVAETIILALSETIKNYSLGDELSISKIKEMSNLASNFNFTAYTPFA